MQSAAMLQWSGHGSTGTLQSGANTHHGVKDMQPFVGAKPCRHAANMQSRQNSPGLRSEHGCGPSQDAAGWLADDVWPVARWMKPTEARRLDWSCFVVKPCLPCDRGRKKEAHYSHNRSCFVALLHSTFLLKVVLGSRLMQHMHISDAARCWG